MPTPTYLRLAPILAAQYGVFTVAQAAAVGIGRTTLRRMVDRGEIVPLYAGVYASLLFPDSWQRRWMAVQLATGPHVAISHRAAAHIHGLQYSRTRRRPALEVTFPRGAHAPTLPVRVHSHVRLSDEHITEADGWRVTDVPWTLASLAHGLGERGAEQAIGAALANDQMTLEAFLACVPRFKGCAGVQILRDVSLRLSPGIALTRSEAERLVLRLVLEAGLPPPEVNLRVVDAAGHVRELDLAWPEWGVCVEVDVHPSHHGALGRNRDGRRQNDLVDDWKLLRFDDLDLQFDAANVVAVIRRALATAGAPLGARDRADL